MDKVTLIFFENIFDPQTYPIVVWVAHKEYPLEFEQSGSYWLKDENGSLRGVDKKHEGELFAKILYRNKENQFEG